MGVKKKACTYEAYQVSRDDDILQGFVSITVGKFYANTNYNNLLGYYYFEIRINANRERKREREREEIERMRGRKEDNLENVTISLVSRVVAL